MKILNSLVIPAMRQSTSNKQKPQLKFNEQNDIFVKSANISFEGNTLKSKYEPLKIDLTDYIMNTSEIDLSEIRKLIKKYSPTTGFDDYKNLPSKNNVHNSATTAYTQQQMQFLQSEDGQIEISKMPQNIFVTIDKDLKKENRIILLDRILHEFTHVLQNESSDHQSYADLYNAAFKRINNSDVFFNTIQTVNSVFNIVENDLLATLHKASKNSIERLPKSVSKYKSNVDDIFLKVKGTSAKGNAQSLLNFLIKNVASQTRIDKKLVLDFVKLKAQNEAEAYQNALNSDKELLGISGATDFDMRIESYKAICSACDSLSRVIK